MNGDKRKRFNLDFEKCVVCQKDDNKKKVRFTRTDTQTILHYCLLIAL